MWDSGRPVTRITLERLLHLGVSMAGLFCRPSTGMSMEWLFHNWQSFAAWTAAQSVVVQVTIGTILLTLAYAVFVCVLSKLTGRRSALSRPSSDRTG